MGKTKIENEEVTVKQEIKEEPTDGDGAGALSHNDKLKFCNPIAHPMANKKLAKKCYKLLKKASANKKHLNAGLKLVQKQLRLGQKGIVIFAGDVFPVEIMSHLPAVCEDKSIPYCYVPSRTDIGAAMGVKRACLVALVKENEEYKDLYDECKSEIKTLPMPL